MAAIDIEKVFANIVPSLVGPEETFALLQRSTSVPGGLISIRRGRGEERFMRVQYEVRSGCPAMVKVRPETLALTGVLKEFFGITEIIDIYSPGDILVDWSPTQEQDSVLNLIQVLLVGQDRPQARDLLLEEGVPGSPKVSKHLRCRVKLRCDFPEQGDVSWVVLPQDPETGDLVQQVGSVFGSACLFRPGACDPNQWFAYEGWLIPDLHEKYPAWAGDHIEKAFQEIYRMDSYLFHIADATRSLEINKEQYRIIGLRRCSRGLPLLPVTAGAKTGALDEDEVDLSDCKIRRWRRGPTGLFSFAAYLRELLQITGPFSVRIFDKLDGQALVPYQVAVLSHEWESASLLFESIWQDHSSAYRALNGGKTAPQIVDQQPRFVAANSVFGPGIAFQEKLKPDHLNVVVQNTFIEGFADEQEEVQPRLRRSDSF